MTKTLYQIVGVPSSASADEIKNAYFKQAAVLRSSGAKADYEMLKQAYDVLADPALRLRYDRQQYTVEVSESDPAQRHWLMTWRGALIGVAVVVLGYAAVSYQQRERTRMRFEAERQETERLAEEARRDAARRQLEADRAKAATERDTAASANSARYSTGSDSRARESLDRRQQMQRQQIKAQQEAAEQRRLDTERAQLEREQRRRAEIERRLAAERDRR